VLYDRLRRVSIPIIAYVGAKKITLQDLLELSEGDVMQLNKRTGDDFVVRIGDEYRYTAKPGIRQNHHAIQITKIISGPDDV